MSIRDWRSAGKLYLWRYPGNPRQYSGWHCTADKSGGEALLELLGAFGAEESIVSRVLPLAVPTREILEVPNFEGGRAPCAAHTQWRISFHPGATDARLWRFPSSEALAHLELGLEQLPRLAAGVRELMSGGGDCCIGQDSKQSVAECSDLWFWWQPGSRA